MSGLNPAVAVLKTRSSLLPTQPRSRTFARQGAMDCCSTCDTSNPRSLAPCAADLFPIRVPSQVRAKEPALLSAPKLHALEGFSAGCHMASALTPARAVSSPCRRASSQLQPEWSQVPRSGHLCAFKAQSKRSLEHILRNRPVLLLIEEETFLSSRCQVQSAQQANSGQTAVQQNSGCEFLPARKKPCAQPLPKSSMPTTRLDVSWWH